MNTKRGLNKELVAESLFRRPVLLVGDVGSGKTTFIRHLMRIEAPTIFRDAISLYIDFGSKAAFTKHIGDFVLEDVERQLLRDHEIDISERNFVRGIYNVELERFRNGIYKDLADSKPDYFLAKEIDFLEAKVAKKEQHLVSALEHVAKGRRKQIILFLDNVDQREEAVQQQVFITAHNIAASWPVAVFLSIRPETFHHSREVGALSGYHTKAFTISPPRVDEVVTKRLAFGLKITSGEVPVNFLSVQTPNSIVKIASLLQVMLDPICERQELIEFLDNISGGNIRLALDLVKAFIGSGHVNTQKILDEVASGERYLVPLHEFIRAVTYGDGVYYDLTSSPIANLFDVASVDVREHFASICLLDIIQREGSKGGTAGFVSIDRVFALMQGFGWTTSQVDNSLSRCWTKRLLETSGRVRPIGGPPGPVAVRVTTVGAYHLQRLLGFFLYYDATIVDTPIFQQEFREKLKVPAEDIFQRLARAVDFVLYLDACWAKVNAPPGAFNWESTKKAVFDDITMIRSRAERRLLIEGGAR